MITGLVFLVAALALRAATANRHIRSRLLVSSVLFAAYLVLAAIAAYGPIPSAPRQQIALFLPLVLAYGAITGLVAVVLNPWRSDRIPDRFPNIVQDAFTIALFAVAATLILQERILATTAVGAVVIGFALQDTLGNLFAGLAIQIEKPFHVGHWVNIAGKDGLVSEITWRATKIRTKAGNLVIVPNSVLARDTITNYSEPKLDTRLEIEVGAGYDTPPHEVKATLLEALRDEPLISRDHQPDVLLVDFAPSAITYRIRVWTNDFAADERVRDRVRSIIYYAFRRRGLTIPYPVQVQISGDAVPAPVEERTRVAAIDRVAIFEPLGGDERVELARSARPVLYLAGEVIVRQGDPGSSMFIVVDGDVSVSIGPTHQVVSRLSSGDFFGEMCLLTGAPRAATVAAVTECELLEITADVFRRFVLANPRAVEQVAAALTTRSADLDRARAAESAPPRTDEPSSSLLARVRRFLRLSATV